MTEEIKNVLHRSNVYVYDVLEIFENFFGEDKVDLQIELNKYPESVEDANNYITKLIGCNNIPIVVYFPKVIVTNENDRYTEIYDLFVKINITSSGMITSRLLMTRSTYTQEQAVSAYTHSHLPRSIGSWESPCLGIGPLNATIRKLSNKFDEDIWNLFCVELNSYVQVESLAGGPYIRLEYIGAEDRYKHDFSDIKFNQFLSNYRPRELKSGSTILTTIDEIISYIINNQSLKFKYINNQWDIAHSIEEFCIIVSNVALEIVKEKNITKTVLEDNSCFGKFIYSEGSFYSKGVIGYNRLEIFKDDVTVLTFKNTPYKLKLIGKISKREENDVTLLQNYILGNIYHILIRYINCIYGNKAKIKGKSEII